MISSYASTPMEIRDDPTMAGIRPRNENGKLRQKRGDAHLETLEAKYGEISDRRSDCHIDTIREATGKSLHKLVHGDPEVTHKPGLNDRQRNQDGTLRQKRGDTHLGTIEKQYGELSHRRSDAHLDTILKDYGVDSLTAMLKERAKAHVPVNLMM
ncbi:MAG: hypothetical protein AB9903_18790 [Vulcanimicrobiota bacterium]